ncbi:MAG: hypothetical protein IJU30_02225, partial [Lachnospiraceae bacterium]|nr:hypothetical protein [Lachnospiraceae bacterium]
MFKTLRKVTAAAAAISMIMSSAAYADVIVAPGVNVGGSSQTISEGPGGAPASEPVVVDNSGAVDAITVEAPVSAATDATSSVPADLTPVGVGSTDVSTAAATGDGSVQVDPIIGYAPFVNAVMVLPSGVRTLGFNSMMDMFMSPEEGLTGLWARLEYGIGDCFYRVFTNEHGWSKWAMNEMYTPSTGDGAKVRAIQMRIKGHTRNLYDLYYRAILDDGTILDWAHDGQTAGAIGSDR